MDNQKYNVEKSLQKTFKSGIWSPFMQAIYKYNLVEDGDHIAVAISGGKDSLLLAKLFQQLEKYAIFDIKVSFIAMDPGFNVGNRKNLEDNLEKLNIPCTIYDENVFQRAEARSKANPCYLCARMRRGSLYAKATELKANKLALGHHLDDVLETVMLNVFFAGKFETMLPKLQSENFPIELIRPLYYVEEKEVIRFRDYHEICAMNCGCEVAAGKISSMRREMKKLVAQVEKMNPDVKKSIFSSTVNVDLAQLLGQFETEEN